ncbi:MAG: hypothetical protein V3R93_00670 [Candidatus Hydrothermarchaeaceae archaeon]
MKLPLVLVVVVASIGALVYAQIPCCDLLMLDMDLLNTDGSNIDTTLLLTIDYTDGDGNPQSINSVDYAGDGTGGTIFWGIYLGKSNLYAEVAAKDGTDVVIMIDGYEPLTVIADRGGYITGEYYLTPLDTTLATIIDIKPDTLNLHRMHSKGRHGRWITAYIELPEGYDVADINVSTVLLGGTIPAKSRPSYIGDYDRDGIPDLRVKFDRADVIDLVKALNLELPADVELAVGGSLNDGRVFEGTDTIRVLEKGRHRIK